MTSTAEITKLIARCRAAGAIIRTHVNRAGHIERVSIGQLPPGPYAPLGDVLRGAGWMPPIQAAERLRTWLAEQATRLEDQ